MWSPEGIFKRGTRRYEFNGIHFFPLSFWSNYNLDVKLADTLVSLIFKLTQVTFLPRTIQHGGDPGDRVFLLVNATTMLFWLKPGANFRFNFAELPTKKYTPLSTVLKYL
jgi:hypothetical protein